MHYEALTEPGRQYAYARRFDSMVCRVALAGYDSGWPAGHVEAAIKTCNQEGAKNTSLPKLSTDEHQLLVETLTNERDREMETVNDHTSVQSVDRAKARSRAALLGHLIEKIK